MKKNLRSLVNTSALAFLTACSHTPSAGKSAEIDESSSRDRLILNANVEKTVVETATHQWLFDTNIMADYVHSGVIYAQRSCVPYTGKEALDLPLELKEAYSRTLHQLHQLDAISENEVQEQQKANEANINKIQKNVSEIRLYCQSKFG